MKRVGPTILGMIFGLIGGAGLGELLIQLGSLNPLTKYGLVFPVGGVVLGFLAGAVGGRKPKKQPIMPPPPAAT
jgi:hypothetical protein